MQNNTLSRPGFSLSGTALKRIACLSMLLDHIGASLLENGLFKQGSFWPGDVQLDGVLRLAGHLFQRLFRQYGRQLNIVLALLLVYCAVRIFY